MAFNNPVLRQWIFSHLTIKVKSFWVDHKIWKKKSYLFECYWVNVKTSGRFCDLLWRPQLYVPTFIWIIGQLLEFCQKGNGRRKMKKCRFSNSHNKFIKRLSVWLCFLTCLLFFHPIHTRYTSFLDSFKSCQNIDISPPYTQRVPTVLFQKCVKKKTGCTLFYSPRFK